MKTESQKKYTLPPEEQVEVVMIKTMSVKNYYEMIEQARRRGWNISAYQIGFQSIKRGQKSIEEL